MSIAIHGAANQGPAEVDADTLAAYLNAKPDDFTSLGHYAIGVQFAINPNSTSGFDHVISNANVLGFQWAGPNLCVFKKLWLTVAQDSSPGAAQTATISCYYAREFTQNFSLTTGQAGQFGMAITPGPGNRLNGRMAGSAMNGYAPPVALPASSGTLAVNPGNIVVPDLAALTGSIAINYLTGAVMTLDASPFASVSAGAPAAAATTIPSTNLYDAKAADYPLVFDALTGFVMQATLAGATSSIVNYWFAINLVWEELLLNNYY